MTEWRLRDADVTSRDVSVSVTARHESYAADCSAVEARF
jgi:hypothetical protein